MEAGVTPWGHTNGSVIDLTPEEVDYACPPGTATVTAAEVELAKRAVVVHALAAWPHGEFCANCHARFPCRLRRWGRRVLAVAGWTAADVGHLMAYAQRTGRPPWDELPAA